MFTRFNYSLTKDEYSTGLSHLAEELSQNVPHGNRVAFQLLGLASLTGLISIWLFPRSFAAVIFTMVEMAVLGAILRWRLRKRPGGLTYDPSTTQSISVTFSDAGVVDGNHTRRRRWQWTAVRKLLDRDGMFVLVMAGWDMIILPKRLWPNQEDQMTFVSDVGRRIGVASPNDVVAERRESIELSFGAIGFAVTVLSLIFLPLSSVPLIWIPPRDIAIRVSGVLLSFAASGLITYLTWRAARHCLRQLADNRPRLAKAVAFSAIWVFPAYLLISYFLS